MHDLYRELHLMPELSMQEYNTQARIEEQLDALGIDHIRCGGTGVVAVIENGPGPTVAFRADIDGLPIRESTELEYASTQTGELPDGTSVSVMHGCGHDTHMTAALTAARLLMRTRHAWSGTLIFIFQPGEETAAGAREMVKDGLWERVPRPEVILGQHLSPGLAGTVELCPGPAMGMAESLRVTMHGRQTHGAQPDKGIDPVVAAASTVMRLQTVVSREVPPAEAAVLTIGTLHAGTKENIVPEKAEFTINIRALSESVRDTLLTSVQRIVNAEAAASGAPEPEVEKLYDFPLNVNDEQKSKETLEVLGKALGRHHVHSGAPKLISEDFGWLGEVIEVPTVFWWFGGSATGDPNGPTNHSPHFAPILEPTLTTGTKAAVSTILYWLKR